MSYYERNREARLAYQKAYKAKNEDYIKAYAVKRNRAYYLAHSAHRVRRVLKPKDDPFTLDGNPKPPKEKLKPIAPETPKAPQTECIPYTGPMERGMFSLSFM